MIHARIASSIHYRVLLFTVFVATYQFAINVPSEVFASLKSNITEVVNQRFLIYENPHLGIKLEYPFLWSLLDFKGKIEGYRDVILVPSLGNSTELSVYLNIANLSKSFNNSNVTLNEFTTQRIGSLEESVPNFNLTNSTNMILGGQAAHRIDYHYPNPFVNNETIRGLEVWTLHNGNAYNFNYIATSTEYSKNLATVMKMINSFKFIGMT